MDDDMCNCACHYGEPIFCYCCQTPHIVFRNKDGTVNWVKYNLAITKIVRSKKWLKKRGIK